MRRSKLFGTFVAVVALSLFGFAGTAQAEPADDAAIIVENLPAAVEAYVDAVESAVDTYNETGSVYDTNWDLLMGTLRGTNTLVQGTEQFGSLGLGLALVASGVVELEEPYLRAIDDPSTAGDLVNPDDLTTLLGQLEPAIGEAQPDLINALSEGLQGNLTAGTGFNAGVGTPALVGNTFVGLREGIRTLVEGTNYEPVTNVYASVVGVSAIATASYAQQVEDALAPVFEAGEPATAPIIEVLHGL